MQDEIKQPMTLEELMGDIVREPFTLPDGKTYHLKNPGELTPNQRRDYHATHRRLMTPGEYETAEEEFADTQHILDLMFHDPLPKDLSDDIAVDWVASLVDFFFNRVTPEQVITQLTEIIAELRERIAKMEGQSNGATSEAVSLVSTESA